MDANELVKKNQLNSNRAMQLVKLHGSVNWIVNNLGEIEEHDYNEIIPRYHRKVLQMM